MSERPILFSGPMVQAILEGRKTQTRRVVKPQPPSWCHSAGLSVLTPPGRWELRGVCGDEGPAAAFIRCPYLPASETRLWVRETWCDYGTRVIYRADYGEYTPISDGIGGPWRPSIHMPRRASRITLAIKSLRAERLQEISEEDAQAEGVEYPEPYSGVGGRTHPTCIDAFHVLWDQLYDKRGCGWGTNPWVWVIAFQRAKAGGDDE